VARVGVLSAPVATSCGEDRPSHRGLSDPLRIFDHVFEGGGFGVGLTVAEAGWSWPAEAAPPPAHGTVVAPRLGELMPVTTRTDAEIAVELQRVDQVEARLAAYRVELIAELAGRRPDALDRQLGEPGAASPDWAPGPGRQALPGVSEFFADELALILNCSRTAATRLADTSTLLTQRLPATWAALADGRLDWPRARALAAELLEPARELEPSVLAQVEAAVLPGAQRLSIRGLRAAAGKELLRRDAAAADRRRTQAQRAADVTVRPARDGMAELTVFLPHPLANAIRTTADSYARMARADGDTRPLGQLRAGVLADLVLRPWDTGRPPVTAGLTVLAPLDTLRATSAGHDACAVAHALPHATPAGQTDPARPPGPPVARAGCGCAEPAEVDGQPITAAHLRSLLEQLDALCPGGLQAPAGGTLDIALTDPSSGALRATITRTQLERLVRRGCTNHPGGQCTCPILDRPPPVNRYRPTPAQERFVSTRDRTCRHPGCHNDAAWADLDHVLPHSQGGATACENLCCLCRRHHRLKTHAPGWSFSLAPDGTLTVTTPSGVTRTTRPPGLRDPVDNSSGRPQPLADDDPPPF
jgi:hypothetical protein